MPPAQTVALTFIASDGAPRQVAGTVGRSLMQAAVDAGIEAVVAECGGTLTCATCHVMVAPEWVGRLAAPGADENAMLEMTAAPREAGSRLACQVMLAGKPEPLAGQD